MDSKGSKIAGVIIAVFGLLLFASLVMVMLSSFTQCSTHEHVEQLISGTPATCTQDGRTDGSQCLTCGKLILRQEPIPALGHQFGEAVVEKDPTDTEYGISSTTCTVCGMKTTQRLDPLTPAATEEPTQPTQEETEATDAATEPTGDDAETDNRTVYGVVIGDVVNIRSGPGTNYDAEHTVVEGKRLTIYERRNGWGRVSTGWIFLEYVYVDGEVGPDGSRMGTIKGTEVNVRSGPGTDYAIKYQVNTGDRVKILFYAKFGKLTWGCTENGWICMDYVVLD